MAVAVVAGIAAVGSAAIAAGTLAIGWGTAAAAFALGAGLSVVGRALAPKPKLNTGASLAGLTTTVREPATSKKLIYGRTRVGGTIVYVDTTGTDNEYLHFVVVLAGHEIDAYEAVYFNDQKVWQGTYQSGWGSYARIKFYKGDQTTADSDLVSESTPWTSNHILNGNAYMYVRLKYDADQFPNGIPNISAIVRGKKIYDPRQDSTSTHYDASVGVNTHRVNDASTWTWSQNPALAVRDYLVDTQYGLGETASAINSAALVTAADYCDVDTDTNSDPIPALQINGVVDTANSRKENIDSMLSAMGGMLVYSGGQYYVRAAQYLTPSVTVDETMMVGQIQVQTRQSRRSQYNGVKGVFLSKEKNYVVADYPAQISSTYATDDGDPIYLDMPLPFVTDNQQAQRLAKIGLLKSRQQTVITVPLNLSGLKFKAGDFIYIDNDKLGWDGKAFEVLDYGIAVDNDGSIRVDVRCIETAASIYNWLSNDAADFLSGGELTLYDGKTTQPPTSLTATESTRINSDGAVIPTIELGWTAAADAFVDHYEVEWKQSTASTYKTVNTVGTEYEIPVPVVGVTYNTRVRAVNGLGVRSTYATANVTMGGDTTAPASPSSPGTSADVHTLVVSWTNPSDLDLSYIEVKRNSVNTEGTATVVGRSSGTSFVDGPFNVATTYYYWVRAVDNSGNASAWVAAGSDTTVAIAEADIADGAVTIDKFGTGLEPVQVVSSLPGTATAGQMAFLTTDNKLYRYNGTAWTAAVPVGDVTGAGDLAALDTITLSYVTDAGDVAALDSISETYIDDDSITTVKINAQAVTAAKIQANTITAAQIAANTITANEIAANTITANQIAANTITSNEIAANTITAGQIAAGTITADELAANAVTGQIFDASSYLRAGSGDNSAVMSGRSIDEYAFWAGKGFETDGGPSGADAPFRVTRDGKVIMTNFALYSEAGTKLFDSQDGLLALPQTAVAQASGSLVPQVSEELTSGTDTFTVTLSSTQTITANFAYPVGALFYSGTSLTDAQNNVSSAFAVTLQYSSDGGSTWNTFGSTQNFSKVTSGTPTSSQYLVIANSFTVSIIYGATPTTVYVASLQSNRGAIDEGMTLVGSTSQSLAAGTYLVRMVFSATGGSGSGAPSTTKTREVRLTTSGAGFTVSDGTVSDGVGTSATTGWVLSNFVEKTESDNVTINGTLTLGGDLVVNGTTTTINSTTLEVDDLNVTLASGAANAAAADGAGITIDGPTGATFTYSATTDTFVSGKWMETAGLRFGAGPYAQAIAAKSGYLLLQRDEAFPIELWGSVIESRKTHYFGGSSTTAPAYIDTSGNFSTSGTVTWSGGGSANANTAYTYSQVGHVPLAGGTMSGNLLFSDSGTTKRGIQGQVGTNDYWFIGGGATAANAGFLEIAAGDDGTTAGSYEPIYVRQYLGTPLTGTVQRTLTLLDNNGNTSIPGSISAAALGINEASRLSPVHITLTASGTALTLQNKLGGTGAAVNLDFLTYNDEALPSYANPGARISAVDDGAFGANLTFLGKASAQNGALSAIMTVNAKGGVQVNSGDLQMGTTSVITASRDLQNVALASNLKYKTTWNGNSLEATEAIHMDAGGGSVLQDSLQFNVAAFTIPVMYAKSGSTWTNIGNQPQLCDGRVAANWGQITLSRSYDEFIFYFGTDLGYTFISAVTLLHSTSGNSMQIYVESSETGGATDTGWTVMASTGSTGSWPGSTTLTLSSGVGGGFNDRFRIRIVPSWDHASNSISLGQIIVRAGYGPVRRLFDWGYDRSIDFVGALKMGGTTFITSDRDITARNIIAKASSDTAVPLRVQRSSASGRMQMTFEDESGGAYWRLGGTGSGSDDFTFFSGTANVLVLDRGTSAATFAGGVSAGLDMTVGQDLSLARSGTSPAVIIENYNYFRLVANRQNDPKTSSVGVNASGVFYTNTGFAVDSTTVIDTSRNLTNIATISASSYATVGAIVAADPGASYYSYNNRIGGGLAVVGAFNNFGNTNISGTISSGAITSSGNLTIGAGTQTANGDANITIREGVAFAGFDFHSARTSGNIGGLRWFSTSSNSIAEAQLLVEVDGTLKFYNGTNGAQNVFTISSTGALSSGAITSSYGTLGNVRIGHSSLTGSSAYLHNIEATGSYLLLQRNEAVPIEIWGSAIESRKNHYFGGSSTTAPAYIDSSGNASMVSYRVSGTTVIDSARAISGTALTLSGSAAYVLDVTSTGTYASRFLHNKANSTIVFSDALFLQNTNNAAGNYVSIGLSTNESDGQHHRAQIRGSRDGTGTYAGKLEFYTRPAGGGNEVGLRIDSNQDVSLPNGRIGVGKSVGTNDPALDVQGVNTTDGTASFRPAAAKGTRVSHLHYGGYGDWYIRSASNSGTVVIQDGGGSISLCGATVDSGRNFSNVGTINSGAITSTGQLVVDTDTEHQIKIDASAASGASMHLNSAGGYAYTVYQNSNKAWRIGAYGGSAFTVRNHTDNSDPLVITSGGTVGINKSSPDANSKLHVDGHIFVDTGHALYSDNILPYATYTLQYGNNVGNGIHNFLGRIQSNGTTVIDSSRNLTNIGTISSGAITSSGNLLVNRTASVSNADADDIQLGNTSGAHGLTILSQNTHNGNIYFADNDNNDAGSIRYNHPGNRIEFFANRAERARITEDAFQITGIIQQTSATDCGVVHPRENLDGVPMEAGLAYYAFNHNTSTHPSTESDFDTMIRTNVTSLKGTGTWNNASAFTLSADAYLVEFHGYLLVTTAGDYRFGVNADDAVDLYIDGVRVADDYGGHGATGFFNDSSRTSIYLTVGYHKLYARFEEVGGGDSIQLGWNGGSGTTLSAIPSANLYRGRQDVLKNYGGQNYMLGNLVLGQGSSTGVLKLKTYDDAASEWHVYNYNDDTFRLNYNGSGGDEMILTNGGNVTFSGNVTAYSDEKLKSDIQTLDGSKVLQMRGVSFTKDGKAGSGVIAQELEKVAPELVHDGEFKSVAYGNLVGYLIEAVKMQQQQIDELKALIKEKDNGDH